MKNYASVKNRMGKPGYRTPSTYISRKKIEVQESKTKFKNKKGS